MNNKGLIQFHSLQAAPCSRFTNKLLTHLLAAMCCLFGWPLQTHADSAFENPDRLMHTADRFIHQEYGHKYALTVDFGYLDSRLHLAKCQQPLEAFFPPGAQGTIASSVGVRCLEPN